MIRFRSPKRGHLEVETIRKGWVMVKNSVLIVPARSEDLGKVKILISKEKEAILLIDHNQLIGN